jgi:putative addiction module component (TIGR02574 family)
MPPTAIVLLVPSSVRRIDGRACALHSVHRIDLAPELARLTPRQRLDLIEHLWESLEDKDIPVTDAQRAELDRRIADFDQDREHSIPWDQLKAELRQRR